MNKLTLNECSKRKLEQTYLVVYAIKNEINIKRCDFIEKSDIYTLIGIDTKGYRQFINIYQDRVNNKRFWLDCFEALKARGLQNILFLSVDDNKNMIGDFNNYFGFTSFNKREWILILNDIIQMYPNINFI